MKIPTPPVQTRGIIIYLNNKPIWNKIQSVRLETSVVNFVGANKHCIQEDEEYRRLHNAQIEKEKVQRKERGVTSETKVSRRMQTLHETKRYMTCTESENQERCHGPCTRWRSMHCEKWQDEGCLGIMIVEPERAIWIPFAMTRNTTARSRRTPSSDSTFQYVKNQRPYDRKDECMESTQGGSARSYTVLFLAGKAGKE